ncbi:zinc finger and SCAN domain-containing protein 2-like [Poeciliopsis prolifica]|uniref:zinc finger and SCAN domain-containing protein 2-like n=1 Tax=Poeciliopsis prolifica TaxID=188132 RepID=UPI00241396B1|nr:zinc finger and SCAN domain-containing protein 2-like [Poeciliopsis prolifica]
MCSSQALREFIRDRLVAAAEEIFSEFEKHIIPYQENARLLDAYWKPRVTLRRLSLPQQHVSVAEEDSAGRPASDRGTSCSQDREEPRPPRMKHEEEDCCGAREEEEAEKKEETHRHTLSARCEEDLPQHRLCVEESAPTDQLLCGQDRTCTGVEEEPEPPQIKEEQEEMTLEAQAETNRFLPTPSCEEGESSVLERGGDILQTGVGNWIQPLAMFVPKEESYEGREAALADDIQMDLPLVPSSTVDAGTQSFRCGFCEKTFPFRCRLIRHVGTHMRKCKFRCGVVKNSFSQNSRLIRHKKTNDSGGKPLGPQVGSSACAQTERLLCKTCGNHFSNAYILKRHTRVHTGEKPFACGTCGKSFGRKDHLLYHTRSHTAKPREPVPPADKPKAVNAVKKLYSCQTCGKRFTRHRYFLHHSKSHSPLVCKTCGRQFRQLSGLKRHESTHSAPRRFPCSICGKSLSRRDHLVRHMKVHAKTKPLQPFLFDVAKF